MFISAMWSLWRATFQEWKRENPTMLAASLSYFALFSLVPTLLVSLRLAGHVFESLEAKQALLDNMASWFTVDVATSVQNLLLSADKFTPSATYVTSAFLVWASMRMFTQLQDALNRVWGVTVPRGMVRWCKSRFRAVLMIGALSVVVFVFVALDIGFAFVKKLWLATLPPIMLRVLITVGAGIFSLGLFTVLFAMVYKVLPERKIPWRDVWVGSLVSSLLFGVARWGLALYLVHSPIKSIYGAAGSILILLVWIYFSMQIVLFGAAFTRAYSQLPRRHRAVLDNPL
jgi:membrane protein